MDKSEQVTSGIDGSAWGGSEREGALVLRGELIEAVTEVIMKTSGSFLQGRNVCTVGTRQSKGGK